MAIFTSFCGAKVLRRIALSVAFVFTLSTFGVAQTDTNTTIPDPGQLAGSLSTSDTKTPSTNAPSTTSPTASMPATNDFPAQMPIPAITNSTGQTTVSSNSSVTFPTPIVYALLAMVAMGGFLLYHCGLTRAKNSGHTSALLLIGILFGLAGYWIGGFAVQNGGLGDEHAALTQPIPHAVRNALNHELGPLAFGHHWGLMGSAGFFVGSDRLVRNGLAGLFLVQASLLAIALGAILGAALERGKILGMAFCTYLIGVLVYPLLANWTWGGGWLAELGREFSLGSGFVDIGGAAVVHMTAGVLALVVAVVLGPRHGRFGRNASSNPIPGHNVPFYVVGSLILLVSWMASNAICSAQLPVDPDSAPSVSPTALAAANTLLAAMGGAIVSFIQAAVKKRRPEPAWICRGLLGGAVASCGCAGLIDPWAAFFIGIVAGLIVQEAVLWLERKRIDDPVGAAAVHGVGGAWGVLAVGLFADGADGGGINGIEAPVRGLFFGGAWHQLAAQFIGGVTTFAVVCLLGYACVNLVQKILGNRVTLAQEAEGLDLSETGALGYQGDVEPGDDSDGKA